MAITFGDNQYGKAEVRLVRITRDGDRHQIKDLNVSTALRGDFADAHLAGDNAKVVATDTHEEHRVRLRPAVRGGRGRGVRPAPGRALRGRLRVGHRAQVGIEEYGWDRIAFGRRRPRARVLPGRGGHQDHRRHRRRALGRVVSGLSDLVVLKSTGSEFWGFPRDATPRWARPRTASWPPRSPRAGGTGPGASSTGRKAYADVRRDPARGVRGQAQPGPAADAVLRWARQVLRAHPRWPRSGCRCRTSTTSSSTWPVRPAQRQRGVCRRRPPVRADRGHGDPRRRAPAGRAWQAVPGF